MEPGIRRGRRVHGEGDRLAGLSALGHLGCGDAEIGGRRLKVGRGKINVGNHGSGDLIYPGHLRIRVGVQSDLDRSADRGVRGLLNGSRMEAQGGRIGRDLGDGRKSIALVARVGEEHIERVAARDRLRLTDLFPNDIYVAALESTPSCGYAGAMALGEAMLIEGVKLLPPSSERLKKIPWKFVGRLRRCRRWGLRTRLHKNCRCGIDGNLGPRRREAGQIDGECEIGDGIGAVEGLSRQDVFGRRLVRPEKMDMARLVGEEIEIVERAAKESVGEPFRGISSQPVCI